MNINQKGIDLIKQFEGCRLSVYKDAVGIPTVGYGHVTQLPVGTQITQTEADALLSQDLKKFETGVDYLLDININENQFSALVCFAFNVGLKNLENSTLLRKVNGGSFDLAADEFLKWDKAGGKVLPGLVKRREAERSLFLS